MKCTNSGIIFVPFLFMKASLLLSILNFIITTMVCAQGHSLFFNATGQNDVDRVKISINPQRAVDVAHDFTIEWWMKALPGDNASTFCDGSNWYYAHIIIDRDIFGPGDFGDYGVALGNHHIMFGVENNNSGVTSGVCGNMVVDDGNWHHVAITRKSSNGALQLFVDGQLDAQLNSSPNTGNISYRDNRSTAYPNSDPFLVLGAEKHDYVGSLYYKGWIDELRISDTIRYQNNFNIPTQAFSPDQRTAALYHFDEGSGNLVGDVAYQSNSPSPGIRQTSNTGYPMWSNQTPFLTPTMHAKIWIEGYFDHPQMSPVLYYQGQSSDANLCDTITCIWNQPAAPYSLIASAKVLVNRNGWFQIPIPPMVFNQFAYLQIKHRNSIPVWSATPMQIISGLSFDFTSSANQAYGSNLKELSSSSWALYSGDLNQDDVIDGLDFNEWENVNNQFAAGYQNADLNGDGVVDGLDFLYWENNNLAFVGSLTP